MITRAYLVGSACFFPKFRGLLRLGVSLLRALFRLFVGDFLFAVSLSVVAALSSEPDPGGGV